MTYKLHISKGNSKLGNLPNLNMPPCPVTACGDMPCKDKCYAIKAYNQYPVVKEAWNDNWDFYNNDPKNFIEVFIKVMRRKKNKSLFRWHSSGELIDQNHLNDLIYIAKELPNTHFLIFTKQYFLDYSEKPNNFEVIYSAWPGLDIPKHILNKRIAFMVDKEGIETRHVNSNTYVCPGITKKVHCDSCKLCWKSNKNVIFPEH